MDNFNTVLRDGGWGDISLCSVTHTLEWCKVNPINTGFLLHTPPPPRGSSAASKTTRSDQQLLQEGSRGREGGGLAGPGAQLGLQSRLTALHTPSSQNLG